MSARIFLHPRVPLHRFHRMLQEYEKTVLVHDGKCELFPILGPPLKEEDAPAVVYECLRCDWQGDVCEWTDTLDFFDPPKGDVPQCPACGDFNLKLHLKDSHAS